MGDLAETVSRSELVSLASRIRELEVQLIRNPAIAEEGGTNACTNCGSNCTNCRGDRLIDVLLPGEELPLSGSELVNKIRTRRGA